MINIRNIRKRLGLTQGELADKLGVTQATVSRFETGCLPIDRRTQLAINAIASERAPRANRGEQAQ